MKRSRWSMLHRIRVAAGYTQAEVAKVLGVCPAYVAHIELGSRAMPDKARALYKRLRGEAREFTRDVLVDGE